MRTLLKWLWKQDEKQQVEWDMWWLERFFECIMLIFKICCFLEANWKNYGLKNFDSLNYKTANWNFEVFSASFQLFWLRQVLLVRKIKAGKLNKSWWFEKKLKRRFLWKLFVFTASVCDKIFCVKNLNSNLLSQNFCRMFSR